MMGEDRSSGWSVSGKEGSVSEVKVRDIGRRTYPGQIESDEMKP